MMVGVLCFIAGTKINEPVTCGAGSIKCIVAFAASEGKSALKKLGSDVFNFTSRTFMCHEQRVCWM